MSKSRLTLNQTPVWVSQHSGKMDGILSVSTSTLDNRFCQCEFAEVCQYCYAKQFEPYRLTLETRLKENSKLLSSRLLKDSEVPRFEPDSTVRFNSFGELINRQHLDNLVKIAELNPKVHFGLWTKRYNLTFGRKFPGNLHLVASAFALDAYRKPSDAKALLESHPEFDRVFVVTASNEDLNCSLECKSCLVCYRSGGPLLIREHLRHVNLKGAGLLESQERP